HLDGQLRQRRRLLPLFVLGGARLRPRGAGGHLRAGLPADRGSAGARHPAAAAQDPPLLQLRREPDGAAQCLSRPPRSPRACARASRPPASTSRCRAARSAWCCLPPPGASPAACSATSSASSSWSTCAAWTCWATAATNGTPRCPP